MSCPDCERYKKSASMWRNKAYELGGTPLPWKRDELWVGLTDEETSGFTQHEMSVVKYVSKVLQEKNT